MEKGRLRMSKRILIKPDGTIHEELTTEKTTLEKAQELVGGYVEKVPHFTTYKGERCIVLADEDGKVKGLPVNGHATKAWMESIGVVNGAGLLLVSNVLVLTGKAAQGWGM
jgi:hypothetical protein